MEMRPHELRELLESRLEYVTAEAAFERIAEIQGDMDVLENDYEQEIREFLNGSGYAVQSMAFNIDIVRETGNEKPPVRYVKVKRRMIRPEGSD